MAPPKAVRIGDGVYRVEHDGRTETVYVAGSADDSWAFWNGQVFRATGAGDRPGRKHQTKADVQQSLTAPMPATVLKVLVQPGGTVRKGDVLVVLEAMKMELPIRAPADGVVSAVHCREGQLVQSEARLVDLQ